MGIYGQPNTWQCGPFALKHGLLSLGLFAHEDDLARLAGSSETEGTDEVGLGRAARAQGCDLRFIRCRNAGSARRELVSQLASGTPVLLCVDQWEHWVTAVSEEGGRIVLFDSYYDTVLRVEPWERLAERLVYRERRFRGIWQREIFDLHPLDSRRTAGARLVLTPDRVTQLLGSADRALASQWDDYARHVLPLSLPRTAQLELSVHLTAFLGTRGDVILDEVCRSRGDGARIVAQRVLERLHFVAAMYDAALIPELEREAAGRMAVAVADLMQREERELSSGVAEHAA